MTFFRCLGTPRKIKIMLLAGGDLIQSFAVPKLWAEDDVKKISLLGWVYEQSFFSHL